MYEYEKISLKKSIGKDNKTWSSANHKSKDMQKNMNFVLYGINGQSRLPQMIAYRFLLKR